MHSRAHTFIKRELNSIQSNPPWGIKIQCNESIFKWNVNISGLKDSNWEDSNLVLQVEFNENFNDSSPNIYFQTIPFHPNIDPINGKPCLDSLNDNWSPLYNMKSVLISIQYLLCNASITNVLNEEAAFLFLNNKKEFDNIENKCIVASKIPITVECNVYDDIKPKKNQRISFEDYHTSWKNLATSIINVDESVKNKIIKTDNQEDMFYVNKSQVQDFKYIPKHNKQKNNLHNKMKNIYLEARNSPRKFKDNEIDDLLQWTKELDEDDI